MSNKPKIKGSRKSRNPNKFQIIKPPLRLRCFNHVGDLAGCGTIRVVYPSMLMNNYFSRDYQFEAMFNNRYMPYPHAYDSCSWVTFQRSATKEQKEIIRHFKSNSRGRPIIYEIDDDLMNIPEWNFASKFYNDNADHIKQILGIVTGVVCSTPELKKILSPYCDNIRVSPNHLPKFIWGDAIPKPFEEDINYRKIRIMYAGSHNHFDPEGDEGDFDKELINFVSKTLDKYQWIFVGGMPQSLKNDNRIIYHEWKPVIEYPRFLKSLNPDIFLAPLAHNQFNKSKSNIKALEAAAMGVPLVATEITPYQGIPYTAETTGYFISLVESLASMDQEGREKVWRSQYDILKDQLFWEDNNYANLFDHINQHLRLTGKELQS